MTNFPVKLSQLACLLALVLAATGCFRGRPSDKPPIHPNPNMDSQLKFKAQSENAFFEDGMSMRPLVEGTVARGWLREDSDSVELSYTNDPMTLTGDAVFQYYTGRPGPLSAPDARVAETPVPVTAALLTRGQERFDIYCAICHAVDGSGMGPVSKRPPRMDGEKNALLAVTALTTPAIRDLPDGHLFDVITNGKGRMKPYKYQITVEDRWAIVSYVRALQRSQNATASDLPEAELQKLNP